MNKVLLLDALIIRISFFLDFFLSESSELVKIVFEKHSCSREEFFSGIDERVFNSFCEQDIKNSANLWSGGDG